MKRYGYLLHGKEMSEEIYEDKKQQLTEKGFTLVTLYPGEKEFTDGLTVLLNSLVKQ